MSAMILAWTKLALCAALIGLAGPVLTRYGDIIASKTGLSRTWIGLILLATATSLPELFTGLSAVTAANAPNIAVGNVLGACIFNLLMLVILDLMHREAPLFSRMDQGHALTAGFGIILIGFVGASLLLGRDNAGLQVLHVGVYTPIIVAIYLVAMRAAFVYERRRPPLQPMAAEDIRMSLAAAVTRYLAAAAVVVAAGVWLPFVGVEIADVMGWRTTFVGTLLISLVTTLPELVVTISALRLGALDLAIGNILGSNLFNILIVAIDDLAYLPGSLLTAASPSHAVTAFAAVIMSGILVVALLYRPATRFHGTIGWTSLSLLIVYLLTTYTVFLLGH
jgi:cation:H+ antiporter